MWNIPRENIDNYTSRKRSFKEYVQYVCLLACISDKFGAFIMLLEVDFRMKLKPKYDEKKWTSKFFRLRQAFFRNIGRMILQIWSDKRGGGVKTYFTLPLITYATTPPLPCSLSPDPFVPEPECESPE